MLAGNLYFDDVGNLEEKIETVIRNAGYDPDTELSYGVNWAYMRRICLFVVPIVFNSP